MEDALRNCAGRAGGVLAVAAQNCWNGGGFAREDGDGALRSCEVVVGLRWRVKDSRWRKVQRWWCEGAAVMVTATVWRWWREGAASREVGDRVEMVAELVHWWPEKVGGGGCVAAVVSGASPAR